MNVFSDKEATEEFLDGGGVMGEVGEIFLVEIRDLLFFELFSCIVCAELGLYFDGSTSHAFELFAFHIHFEFRLYF